MGAGYKPGKWTGGGETSSAKLGSDDEEPMNVSHGKWLYLMKRRGED